jgi:hypothetical protein
VKFLYGCPDCGYEFAMLTNPMETQVVGSLGVTLGAEGESKCPFTGMANEMGGREPAPERMSWSSEAEQRMARIPEFLEPMVRSSIERFARDRGYAQIDEKVLDEAKGQFGMD